MAGYDSYDDFQELVAINLQRANLTQQIPWFIQQAETRFRDLFNDFPQQKAEPYILVPAVGTNVITLPSDFSAISKVTYGNRELQFIAMEAMSDQHTRFDARLFAMDGNYLYLQTAVNGESALVIYYYSELPALTGNEQTNWLLEDYPSIYLYATLREAAVYMMDDERLPVWEQLFQQAVQSANSNKRQLLTPTNTRFVRKII